MSKIKNILIGSIVYLTLNCSGDRTSSDQPVEFRRPVYAPTTVKYASRFDIRYFTSHKEIKVKGPWPGSQDSLIYILSSDPEIIEATGQQKGVILITQPVKNVVCFSTTHLPFLEMIGEEHRLSGFPTTDYIYSEKIRDLVNAGKITDLGPSNEINMESLLALSPDLVIAFSMGNETSMLRKIGLSGIPVVLNADYMEDHPLGRAEWIKFMATFFNKDLMADSIFKRIETSYLATKAGVDETGYRPGVFTGVVYGDAWFMPGGNHYGACFFRDAGGNYLWSENDSDQILQLSFESVYEKAGQADFWIGTATYNSLEEIRQADSRYAEFKAFQTGQVYSYTAKMNSTGGNAYFETGYARPDLILKDLAKILHPEKMKNHTFFFYRKLY